MIPRAALASPMIWHPTDSPISFKRAFNQSVSDEAFIAAYSSASAELSDKTACVFDQVLMRCRPYMATPPVVDRRDQLQPAQSLSEYVVKNFGLSRKANTNCSLGLQIRYRHTVCRRLQSPSVGLAMPLASSFYGVLQVRTAGG